ncbi:MAG: AAA family ATPase [Firmicutes bacterium]|nr:AAA family ATPase [Bacillota bacterium]
MMADKLRIPRKAAYNRSDFFPDYVDLCHCEERGVPEHSRIVTSDDVFNYLLQIRHLNEDLDAERESLFEEYNQAKYRSKGFQMRSLEDYDQLKKIADARRKTGSAFVKDRLSRNIREHSNGESAFKYFTEEVKENALYLLDEPENSMAPKLQLELKQFIEDSARFFGCQFVIATHSPFLLAMKQAVIYDLDADPVRERKWTELENVRTYYQFFKEHERELEE